MESQRRRRRWPWWLLALLLAVPAVCWVFPALPRALLRGAGEALVAEDPEAAADVAVVSVDAGAAGVLQAADLVRRGLAPRVALFVQSPDPIDEEFRARGIPFEDHEARLFSALHVLGVDRVERVPTAVNGTEAEARVLPEWAARRGYRTIVFVCMPDHSRRTRRSFARAMQEDRGLRVIVRATRYAHFDADAWWRSREGVRTELIEAEKLLVDVVLHPLQ